MKIHNLTLFIILQVWLHKPNMSKGVAWPGLGGKNVFLVKTTFHKAPLFSEDKLHDLIRTEDGTQMQEELSE